MGYPDFVLGLMNTAPGSIDRRFPKYWSDNEGGIDWGVPKGTPIVALADGVLAGAGYFCASSGSFRLTSDSGACSHGVVTTRVTNQDGTQTDLYYQHIILSSAIKPCFDGIGSCGGQTVKKGQVIGYASDMGEIEMGVNVGNSSGGPKGSARWGTIWGADPNPGSHVDPEAYLRALISGKNTTGTVAASDASGNPLDILAPLNTLFSQLAPFFAWASSPTRVIKMTVGILLVALAIYLLVVPETAQKVGKFIKNNPEILAV